MLLTEPFQADFMRKMYQLAPVYILPQLWKPLLLHWIEDGGNGVDSVLLINCNSNVSVCFPYRCPH